MSLHSMVEEYLEARIDFVGQQLVDQILRIFLIAATVVSFVVGFVLQSLRATFTIYGTAVGLLALIVLPPWPMFKQHPVQWLPVVDSKTGKEIR